MSQQSLMSSLSHWLILPRQPRCARCCPIPTKRMAQMTRISCVINGMGIQEPSYQTVASLLHFLSLFKRFDQRLQ
jgi:hypothetical protein